MLPAIKEIRSKFLSNNFFRERKSLNDFLKFHIRATNDAFIEEKEENL